MSKNQHVVKKDGDWTVKGAGNSKATKKFDTQKQAIDFAKEIAKNQKSEVVIHGVFNAKTTANVYSLQG